MKNIIKITLVSALTFSAILNTGCKENDNEEELITTVKLSAVNKTTGAVTTATFADPDGDGGNGPTQFDSLKLSVGASYETTITVLDQSKTVGLDITAEVIKEANDHQFYYSTTANGVTIATTDVDANELPLGVKTTLNTTTASTGRLQIKLKHKPDGLKKAVDTDAVGDTDIELPLGGFYIDVK
jgi:hypothetical protein